MRMSRVFIVAVSPLSRSGLRTLLAGGDVEVAGSAPDLESLAASIASSDMESEVDVVVMEVSGNQVEQLTDWVAQSELAPEIPIIVLAAGSSSPRWAGEALRGGTRDGIRGGIRAVLPGEISGDQLIATIDAVKAGLLVLHPSEVDAMVPAPTSASPLAELAEPLTPREREVLQMLAAGLANKEIAGRLNISDHTAKFHVGSILGKLGASSRAEAVAVGIRRGLVLL
jgi:NarL family two-component system response regulator YdfI